MAPNKPKASPAPAGVSDNRKTTDALWLFEQFMHCDPPMVLNVAGIAEATGMKSNTIVKRINTMQHRYPGFGIVTTTKGSRQSSNLVVASPKIDSNISARKPATGGARSKTKNKDVDTAESDGEEDSRRKARGRSRAGQVRAEDEAESEQPRRQTRASTIDNVISREKTTEFRETPQILPSNKGKAPSKDAYNSDDEEDASDREASHESGGEWREKKAPTPKTRAGRKSAGLGEIKNALVDPEMPAPRGRHALPSEANGAKQRDGLTEEIANAGDGASHGLRRLPAALNQNTKRKRSVSPDNSSSPLTPLPDIWKKIDQTQDVDQVHQSQSPDMRPPTKKSKPSDPVDTQVAASANNVGVEDGASTVSQESERPLVIVESLKNADAQNRQMQVDNSESLDTDPVPIAQSAPMANEVLKGHSGDTTNKRAIADMAKHSTEDSEGEDNRSIRPLWGPSVQNESLAEWATKSDERGPKMTSDQVVGPKQKSVLPTETEADSESSICNQEPLSEKVIASDSTLGKSSDMPSGTNNANAADNVDVQGDEEVEQPEQLEKRSYFSRPLEWMIWNPAAKSTNARNLP